MTRRRLFGALAVVFVAVMAITIIRCPPLAFTPFSYAPHERPRVFVSHHPIRAVPGAVVTVRLAPDLVAEVLSKSDTASELEEKVADYLSAGTRLLWAIDPDKRRVAVHSPAAPTRWLHERDTLDGDDVVPGFTMPVAELFEGLARSA